MKDWGIQLTDNADTGDVLDLKIELVKDSKGKILSGLVLGNTLQQNKALILIAQPGDLKLHLDFGVGIEDLTLDDNLLAYRHEITEMYGRDGLKIEDLDLYDVNNINIEAHYGL